MKLMLIAPASGKWQKVAETKLFNGRLFRFSLLSLLSVAAETPPDTEIQIVDEQIENIPWDAEVDLVGITCMTATAPRAYEISRRFRQQNIPVVLGGMHPTLCPDEAIQNADAIVTGDAEDIWKKVISDARAGSMQGRYCNNSLHSLKNLKPPPRNLLKSKKYATVYAHQATRGCPHGCDFCSISVFNNKVQRQRPVEEVVNEIAQIPERFFLFIDDNLTADREYARRLFNALIPLKKLWVTQSTLSLADDPDFVRLAAEAGCTGLFVGLETFSDHNLNAVNKAFNHVEKYREAIELLHSHGIGIEAGIVFGFDGDRPDVFERTLNLLDKLEVDAIQVSVFTPIPGTSRFESMKDRIFNRNWSDYDFHNVVFQPRRMSAQALQAGHDWVTYEFYRPWRIARRLLRHIRRPRGFLTLPYVAAINLAYYGRITRWGIKGRNPLPEIPDQSQHFCLQIVKP
ncbi:MAG: B12-binding domain-containing radical SAM protein [Desulfobacterales bacterium]|nr:B12-binding domain-containing radical SAM protein [Desulfobacterales bacterium]